MRSFLVALLLLAVGAIAGSYLHHEMGARPPSRHSYTLESGHEHQDGTATPPLVVGRPTDSDIDGERGESKDDAGPHPALANGTSDDLELLREIDAELAKARRSGSTDLTEPELWALVGRGNPDLTISVAMLLAFVEGPPWSLLHALLSDPDPSVEYYALASIASRADELPQAYECLTEYCARSDSALVAVSVRGLSVFGARGASEILQLVGDPRQEVQSAVAVALGSLGTKGADAAWHLLASGEFSLDDLENICCAAVQSGLDWSKLQALRSPEVAAAVAAVAASNKASSKGFSIPAFNRAADTVARCRPNSLGEFVGSFLDLDTDPMLQALTEQLTRNEWTHRARLGCLRGLLECGHGAPTLDAMMTGREEVWERLAVLKCAVEASRDEEIQDILHVLDLLLQRGEVPLLRRALEGAAMELRDR